MKAKKNLKIVALLIGAVVLLASCGQTQKNSEKSTELKVVTTFFPIYDFTRQVVGDEGEVSLLVDGNIEPHDFEPSAKDIARIQEADVFVYHSDEMEGWVPNVLAAIDTTQVTVIKASEGLELLAGDEDHDHEHSEAEGAAEENHDHENESDLHLHGVADHYHSGDEAILEAHGYAGIQFEAFEWVRQDADGQFSVIEGQNEAKISLPITESVVIGLRLVDQNNEIKAEITPVNLNVDNHDGDHGHGHAGHDHHHEFDPHTWLDPQLASQKVGTITEGLSQKFPAKSEAFAKNSQAYQAELNALDQRYTEAFKGAENRLFITQHTAFAYLANRYNLEQRGISGFSPELEPTARELAEMETFVKENHVKVIFTEDQASEKIAKTVATSTGAELAVLSPLENISQADQAAGETYLTLMDRNLTALQKVIK